MGVVVDDEEDDKDNNNDSENDEYDKDDHLSHRGSPIHFLSKKIGRQRRQFFARAKKSQARLMWPATSVVSKVPVESSGVGRVTGWMGGWEIGGFFAGRLESDWLEASPRER